VETSLEEESGRSGFIAGGGSWISFLSALVSQLNINTPVDVVWSVSYKRSINCVVGEVGGAVGLHSEVDGIVGVTNFKSTFVFLLFGLIIFWASAEPTL